MINSSNGEKVSPLSWLYPPMVILLLIAGAFWVGRLSAQVDLLKGGNVIAKGGADAAQPSVAVPTQSPLNVDSLKTMASKVGVDTAKFNSCLDSGKYAQKVKDDLAYAGTVGVNGTPTFFVNGLILVGAQPQAQFEGVIDAELKDGSGAKVLSTGSDKVTRKTIKTGVGYVKGNANAKVKLVEFSDFECPFCGRAEPTVEALLQKYGDRINLEYRHNPLPFHADAQKAAEASECAGEQGKFWEMHDQIFSVHS